MTPRTLAVALLAGSLFASGCSSPCAEIKKDWDTWRAETTPFLAEGESADAAHMGVTLRVATLNQLLDTALTTKMTDALAFSDKIRVATGNAVAVRTEGKVVDLGLFPDKACDTCLRVEGKLDGRLAVKIPLLGEQAVPLRGTFQLVGPVEFGASEEGKSTVVLDLAKVAELNASRVTAEIAQLPPTWKDALESPLSKRILQSVGERLGPVTLFEFEPLDVGIEGLKVSPHTIRTDAKRGLVYAGFRTNLRGVTSGLTPLMDLQPNENAAFAIDPGILGSAVTAMQRSGKLAEEYDHEGQPKKGGPLRAAVNVVSAAAESSENPGYVARFRVWNLDESETCYWADATAEGDAKIEGENVEVSVRDVSMTNSSMNGVKMAIANWAFLSRIDKVISRSLSAQAIEVPGSKVSLGAARLIRHGAGIAVAGKLSAEKTE